MSTTRPPVFDDRSSAPVEASRRGAHRARPNPVTAVLPVMAAVAVVLLIVAGAYTLLKPADSTQSPTAAAPTAEAPPPSAPSAAPSPSGDGGTGTEPTESAQPSATEDADAGTGGEVDRDVEVRVLNSIQAKGLAKRVADTLEDDGWTVGGTGNSVNRNLRTTKVYYATNTAEATAAAVVADLGYGAPSKNAQAAGDGITVVLGEDARS